jgi:hypothetical protein
MKKHTSEEAYYERLRNLAVVNKTIVKESQSRNLGTLIDYKRAADGIAYGIIKENHSYYIKKSGLKEDPNVADFAYIGGLANVTDYQYKKLSEAEKQRNLLFRTINEAVSLKSNKTGSKKRLNEDKAGEEIKASQEMAAGLDAAKNTTSTSEPTLDLGGEPENGLETPAPTEEPIPNTGAEEQMPPTDVTTDEVPAGDETGETPTDDETGEENSAPENDTEGNPEDQKNITTKEIEKSLGKLTEKIRKTEMTDSQVKSYVNSFLAAFKDKFPDVEIEDRKAMAEKITKVVPDEDIEDLGLNVEKTEPEEVEEEQCVECGSFAKFAESRGYNAQSIQECGEEEMTNLVSGYANAHNDGQNDGDFKAVALFITPEILDKLKSDYGHDEYGEKLTPYTNELGESDEASKKEQIEELFGGIGNAFKKVGGDIKNSAQAVSNAVTNKVQKGAQAVGQYAQGVKQAYHAGEVPGEVKKLEGIAANLGKQVQSLNTRLTKSGQQPIDIKNIIKAISQQITGKGAGVAGLNPVAESLDDPAKIETQPIEEIKVPEPKSGQKLSATAPIKQIKEEEEEPEIEDDTTEEEPEIDVEDDTTEEKPEINIAPAGETLGGGVVKPEGAGVEIRIEPDKSIDISMNESERKLRKYIRNRLEEHAGTRKPILSESKKSVTLKKLDSMIDKQFKLSESAVLKKKDNVNEIFGFGIKEKFAKLDPNNAANVEALFTTAFRNILINPSMGRVGRTAKITPTNKKYDILKLFVDNGGGTLRVSADGKTVEYQPQSVKNAATKNDYSSSGGNTSGTV